MLNKLKPMVLSGIAFLGVIVALGGIKPASIGTFHQPELPEGYK